MPITEKQREQRTHYLGSTDMAAILGVSPWGNAYDVWLEKTGKVDKDKEKDYQGAGNFFEEGVLKWSEQELGPLITEENGEAIFRQAVGFPLGSHPDGLVQTVLEPVEAKTAGLFGPLVESWGEAGTDQLPDRIIIQTHVHMECTNKAVCHVPVFLGGKGFVMYHVDRDPEIADIIRDKSLDFWEQYVEADCPPPDIMPSLAMARRMKREPGKTIDIETQIVQNWINAKDSVKIAETIRDSAHAELLASLGDAEGGQSDLGLLTFLEQTTRRLDSTRLKAEKPDIAAEFMKASTFRVLRLKKPKPSKGA